MSPICISLTHGFVNLLYKTISYNLTIHTQILT